MAPLVTASKQMVRGQRVLVVDDEPQLLEAVSDVAASALGCRVTTASTIAEARRVLVVQSVDLLIVDIHLPDGDGTSLIELYHKHNPAAGVIIITGQPSMEGAINALRGGANDFLPKPFNSNTLIDRMRKALTSRSLIQKQTERIDRLRDAVRRLNSARRTVSKKVDLLCNDLIGAYGELSQQLDQVRIQESFRRSLKESKDLEQMLCHAMDWLLRQVGYSNVAIWLATDSGEMQLGAYMKYTIAGDEPITNALLRVIVPQAVQEGFILAETEDLRAELSATEADALRQQQFVGINCTYLGETLASMVLFRDTQAPFTDEDAATLQAIASIFAVQLAGIVRDPNQGESEHDEEPNERNDSADWWKRGENPPF